MKFKEEGIFSDDLRLSGIGMRKRGENYKAIGDFTNGNINHHIILVKGAVYKWEKKIGDIEDRTDQEFSGWTYDEKPVSNMYA